MQRGNQALNDTITGEVAMYFPGVPVVLFMENYDINRHGYHDSHDTMENIDLDYGAAVAAIAAPTTTTPST